MAEIIRVYLLGTLPVLRALAFLLALGLLYWPVDIVTGLIPLPPDWSEHRKYINLIPLFILYPIVAYMADAAISDYFEMLKQRINGTSNKGARRAHVPKGIFK